MYSLRPWMSGGQSRACPHYEPAPEEWWHIGKISGAHSRDIVYRQVGDFLVEVPCDGADEAGQQYDGLWP